MRRSNNIIENTAFIGFGEAAQAFLSGWGSNKPDIITAYDIKTENPATASEMMARYVSMQVNGCLVVFDAVKQADAVFCVVTADQAEQAAKSASHAIKDGTFWFDCNSCAPETKRRAAMHIEAAGGRYVDVAVMAPVHPKLHKVPLLLSGPHAEEAARGLAQFDMSGTVVGNTVGEASAIKMLRSVMIKGMEALTAECFLAARKAGVDEKVIASLVASNPQIDWPVQGAYNLERMMVHGTRRAAEMREVAITIADLGLPNGMSAATAVWQDTIATLNVEPGDDALEGRLESLLKRL